MADALQEVYDDLRRTARRMLRNEPYNHTLESCELVHRAWERLLKGSREEEVRLDPRGVVALAVTHMRRELIDHARKRRANKRPDAKIRVTLDDAVYFAQRAPDTLLAVDSLLEQLAEGKMGRIRHAARRAEVARYALYGGLTEAEISIMLDIPKSTIGRDIRFVRAWLMTRLEEGQGDG